LRDRKTSPLLQPLPQVEDPEKEADSWGAIKKLVLMKKFKKEEKYSALL
jgi:hypothetical protein